MSMAMALFPVIALLFLTSPGLPFPSDARSLQDKLASPVAKYDSRNESLVEAVLDLAYRYQLPTAIHYVDRAAVHQPLSVALSNVTAKQVIEAVVHHAPGYRVRLSNGLVQVYSPAAEEDSSNPLNTVIEDFDIADLPRQEAEIRLFGAFVSKVSPGAGYGGDMPYGPEPPVLLTLHLRRARVSQILDAIVAGDGSSIWLSVPTLRKAPAPGTRALPWVVFDLRRTSEEMAVERLNAYFDKNR